MHTHSLATVGSDCAGVLKNTRVVASSSAADWAQACSRDRGDTLGAAAVVPKPHHDPDAVERVRGSGRGGEAARPPPRRPNRPPPRDRLQRETAR